MRGAHTCQQVQRSRTPQIVNSSFSHKSISCSIVLKGRAVKRSLGCRCVAADASEAATPSRQEGRMIYRPNDYNEIVEDASVAVLAAIGEGYTRLEVEFPALGGLDSYKGASDTYIDSNTQLALQAGRLIHQKSGKKCIILLPDGPEYDRSSKLFKATLGMLEGVSLSHLFEGREPFMRGVKLIFGMENDAEVPEKATQADVHIVINVSAGELPDVQAYMKGAVKEGSTLVFWNCELDTLRADLGQFGFPPKALQYEFLSQFKPAFYVRQRDYSKTVNIAPFTINYSGCLFREFPGPWQVMLRQDNGEYACIAERRKRYTLGEAKEALMEAMGLNTEEKGSTMEFLRRGYRTSTWWEDDADKEASDAWRS